MRRFWKDVEVVEDGDGFGIALDGRRVKTPAKADLAVPTLALADAVAAEWRGAGDTIDPRAMPLTGLANAAIDRVAVDTEAFAASLSRYGETDLFCYRADAPAALAELQDREWGPLLAWARRRHDIDFAVTEGIGHVPQPRPTIDRLGHAVAALDAFRLAALSPLVSIGGSLIAALAVAEDAVGADQAWDAVTLDERWQAERWGWDEEANKALEIRRRDFLAAARFLELLD
jgi:chaperone required for assembly of F1-ATPase